MKSKLTLLTLVVILVSGTSFIESRRGGAGRAGVGVGRPGVGVGRPGVGRPGVGRRAVGRRAVGRRAVGRPGVGRRAVSRAYDDQEDQADSVLRHVEQIRLAVPQPETGRPGRIVMDLPAEDEMCDGEPVAHACLAVADAARPEGGIDSDLVFAIWKGFELGGGTAETPRAIPVRRPKRDPVRMARNGVQSVPQIA